MLSRFLPRECRRPLSVAREMLYYNTLMTGQAFRQGARWMKWFRANIRLGSRLALLALAIQFVLSFGHFHVSIAQASTDARPSSLHAARFAPSHLDSFGRHSDANAVNAARSNTSSDRGPAGQPADDCAMCAVMALANAAVVATPPDLLAPQAAAFLHLVTDVAVVDPNSALAAFQPRAPPIS